MKHQLSTFSSPAARLLFVLLTIVAGSPAFADHAGSGATHYDLGLTVPTTNGTGSYVVTWTPGAGVPYNLQEKKDSGGYTTVYTGTGSSKSFSGKTNGTYTYRLYYEICWGGWGGCTKYYSHPESVVVSIGNIASPPTESSTDEVGTSAYGIDVSTSGDAIVTLPLDLIPGVAGFKPDLSLEYDSGRGVGRIERRLPEDILGYGWRLAGLSEIRRCVVGQASGNSINLSNNDSLCLDGVPLVRSSGTHFSVGAQYRTMLESYRKVEIKGSSGSLWFEVKAPDGTVLQYGNSTGSRVDKNGGTDYAWSLSKATSADGNVVDYTYYHDAANGINYPTLIGYTDAEVEFLYRSRTDAAAVSIGSASQKQSAFLHTIIVYMNSNKVREYRLLDEVVSSRRRLNKIQQCGYNESGSTASCLKSIDIDWTTPGSTMAGVDILVSQLTDGLGANHQFQYTTLTSASGSGLFTERPFGSGSAPTDTQLLTGSGALRHVVTKLRRDNGLSGYHDSTYRYQDRGLKSTKHWGFLGFYAQRIKDEQSGIVTYGQYRMDYPNFGSPARVYQYNNTFGAQTETISRSESDYGAYSKAHAGGSTTRPYRSRGINFAYEGNTMLGGVANSSTLSFDSAGLPTQVAQSTTVATGVTTGSTPSGWGRIPAYTFSGVQHSADDTVKFTNRTSGATWLVGFVNETLTESWKGSPSGAGVLQKTTFAPHSTSNRVSSLTRFPGDPSLNLTVSYTYYSNGLPTSVAVSGANVSSRTTTRSSTFTASRYPLNFTNAKNQTTDYDSHDLRFGTPKEIDDPNGQSTLWARDPFGRLTSHTNSDSVVQSTNYKSCAVVSCPTVNGVAAVYRVETDSIIAPIKRSYHDKLGRPIRTEVESFGGSYSKSDTWYDNQGRVKKASMPYFSGTPAYATPTYDIRGRVTNNSRPDGSSTGVAYSVSGSTVIVTVTDNIKNANGTSGGSQVKRNEFNILEQLVKTTDGYGTSSAVSVTYVYDANGNLTTATVNGGSAGTTVSTFENDSAGNQTKAIDPNSGTVTSTYTALGQVRTITDNLSQVSTYSYDVLDRATSLVNADGTSTWVWDTATNGSGKLKSRSTGSGFTETYAYNSKSRLSNVTTNITAIGAGSGANFTTAQSYDTYGRPLTTTYPGSYAVTTTYNARGYVSQLKNGSAVLQTFNATNAFGNSTQETYGNGVVTNRTFDPETGRLTDINTTKGATVIQNLDFAWRSNGTLENRLANPTAGVSTTREEVFDYDPLNRVVLAETFIGSSNTRDLSYQYNLLGNIVSKLSTLAGDTDVSAYGYGAGAAGPHAATSATIDGVGHTLTYDGNGAITKYDIAGTSNDKYVAYNGANQPTKIVIGNSLTDTTPEVVEEFRYAPNGQRYARKSTWKVGGTTRTENVRYIGNVEYITFVNDPVVASMYKTKVSNNIMRISSVGVGGSPIVKASLEYAHSDHLGSVESVTDQNGNLLHQLAFEPYGARKGESWQSNIGASELDDVLENTLSTSAAHARLAGGFTGHEHLDRTNFVHMNGRVYDPVIGRFLSPDPIVHSGKSQSWNKYSYTTGGPLSLVDPSGFDLEEIVVVGTRTGGGSGLDTFGFSLPGSRISFMSQYDFENHLEVAIENCKNGWTAGCGEEVIEEVKVIEKRSNWRSLLSFKGLLSWLLQPDLFATGFDAAPPSIINDEFLDVDPCITVGLHGVGSGVNPLTSGDGGILGYNAQLFLSLEGFSIHDYTFSGEGGGLDAGVSLEIVTGIGTGPWRGDFNAITGNVGALSGSVFSSPDASWLGYTFGGSAGAPYGLAVERTNYQPAFDDDGVACE